MAEIIGSTIIKLKSVDSTNNYATKFANNNKINEGLVVICDEQFNGRGQINNTWESEKGKNILMSIVLFPEFLPIIHQFQISKVVTLAIVDVLSVYIENVSIKWPNDIYVDDKKIAGILIENSIMGHVISTSIVGIGLNVNQQYFRTNAPNPVSLFQLLDIEVDREYLLNCINIAIEKWYCKLKVGEFYEINENYLRKLYRLGELFAFRDKTGEYLGSIIGVNEIGQLLIKPENDNVREYHFKEVEFVIN